MLKEITIEYEPLAGAKMVLTAEQCWKPRLLQSCRDTYVAWLKLLSEF